MAKHAHNTPTSSPAKPSRRKLLKAGAALAAAGTVPAAAAPAEVASAAPHPDAELIRLADLAVELCRAHTASLSDAVHIPPEAEAETDRLSDLADDCHRRAAAIPAATDAGKRAKAQIVALANSHNLACIGDTAFITLESLLDDLMGGEGACAAFDWHVHRRDRGEGAA